MSNRRRLRPIEIPESVIQQLAESLKIDTAKAVDLIMLMQEELQPKRPERKKAR
jgi:hypothetical protein